MSDPAAPAAPTPPAPAAPAKPSPWRFTDPGCRSDLRLGALLVVAGVFLWLFAGPKLCMLAIIAGAPLFLFGVAAQAVQARGGRPGFPWKLGIAMTVFGVAMCWDLRYREAVGQEVKVVANAVVMLAGGLWILLWWPVAAIGRKPVAEQA